MRARLPLSRRLPAPRQPPDNFWHFALCALVAWTRAAVEHGDLSLPLNLRATRLTS